MLVLALGDAHPSIGLTLLPVRLISYWGIGRRILGLRDSILLMELTVCTFTWEIVQNGSRRGPASTLALASSV